MVSVPRPRFDPKHLVEPRGVSWIYHRKAQHDLLLLLAMKVFLVAFSSVRTSEHSNRSSGAARSTRRCHGASGQQKFHRHARDTRHLHVSKEAVLIAEKPQGQTCDEPDKRDWMKAATLWQRKQQRQLPLDVHCETRKNCQKNIALAI